MMFRNSYPVYDEQQANVALFDNIIITVAPFWQCDANCIHCFIPFSLRKKSARTSNLVKKALSELPDNIKAVTFTGGEPFLHPRTLLTLVRAVKSKGRHSTVITNGSWYRQTKDPRSFLRRFHRAGMRGISVSIDTYHRPPLSNEEIIAILSLAREVGMAVNIRGAGQRALTRARTIARSGVLNGQEGSVSFFVLENVGHAIGLSHDRNIKRRTLSQCLAATQPLITPEGKILACCSAHVLRIKNTVLELGHLKNESLKDILDRGRKSYLLAALAGGGPLWLLEILGRKPTRKAIGDKTRCELCLEILNDPANVAELRRRIAKSKELRKEIAGRMMVWEQCYRPELLPQFQSGV